MTLEQGARPSLVRSSMKPPAQILRICCHYGMTTAADAVETVEAHSLLNEAHCAMAQPCQPGIIRS